MATAPVAHKGVLVSESSSTLWARKSLLCAVHFHMHLNITFIVLLVSSLFCWRGQWRPWCRWLPPCTWCTPILSPQCAASGHDWKIFRRFSNRYLMKHNKSTWDIFGGRRTCCHSRDTAKHDPWLFSILCETVCWENSYDGWKGIHPTFLCPWKRRCLFRRSWKGIKLVFIQPNISVTWTFWSTLHFQPGSSN